MNIDPLELVKQVGVFQEKLATISAAGSAGGGMVEITLNGKLEVTAVKIAPEALESGDVDMLQDLVQAAFSSGLERIREAIGMEMGMMTGNFMPNGMDFSGMMGNS